MPKKYIKKTNRPPRAAYDWDNIEADYVSDPQMTYEKLSKKYGPTLKTICDHAQKGNWKDKRSAYKEYERIKTQQKLAEIRGKEVADEIAKMNKAHYESQQGVKYLADKQIIADVEKLKTGQTGKLTVKQIQTLANANKTIQESQRLAKGLSEKELNINLVTQQLAPFIEKIVEVIQKHVPAETTETLLLEFRKLFGEDVP